MSTTTIEAKLVGTHFRGSSAKEIVSLFETGTEVELEREPENEYDLYAIKVMFEGHHIGYINREVSSWIAPDLDELLELNQPLPNATVIGFEEGAKVTYPILHIELEG